MMTSGRSLTVYYYHGNDGYLHAVTTVGARSSSSASVNTASTLTATGTVNGELNREYAFPRYTSGTDGNQARFRQRNQRLQGSGHQPAHFRYLCVWLRRLSARGYDHCKIKKNVPRHILAPGACLGNHLPLTPSAHPRLSVIISVGRIFL